MRPAIAIALSCTIALAGCMHDAPTEPDGKLPNSSEDIDSLPQVMANQVVSAEKPVADQYEAMFSEAHYKATETAADGYSKSSDLVHPSLACSSKIWNGSKCWIAYTPYKNGNSAFENPSELYSASQNVWKIPAGGSNPLFVCSNGYCSDPDQLFDPKSPGGERLVMTYREVAEGMNKIWMISTLDAVTWSKPTLAFQMPNHDAISPTIIPKPGREFRMLYVKGNIGCGAGVSEVAMRIAHPAADQLLQDATWSEPIAVKMQIPGYVVWHFASLPLPQKAGGKDLMLITAFPVGTTCSNSDEFIASSDDDIKWTVSPAPILWRAMAIAKKLKLLSWYRGTMHYVPAWDEVKICVSQLRINSVWKVGCFEAKLTDLMYLMNLAKPADGKALLALNLKLPLVKVKIEEDKR